jgi:hypothetical protein
VGSSERPGQVSRCSRPETARRLTHIIIVLPFLARQVDNISPSCSILARPTPGWEQPVFPFVRYPGCRLASHLFFF